MAKSGKIIRSRRMIRLEREWVRRFGEPPAISADADLLGRILRDTKSERRP